MSRLRPSSQYNNLVCVLRRYNLGAQPAPHLATISCVALFTFASTGASGQSYFVWDSSKGKSTGSDHLLHYKRYNNVVCVLRRSIKRGDTIHTYYVQAGGGRFEIQLSEGCEADISGHGAIWSFIRGRS
jgi:hypothetical protein